MRVAVIIPTLGDDGALQRLLARIARLDPPADEVVVVDGAADAAGEACKLACRNSGANWVATHPVRGGQLALGAARAHSDVLWFVRVDCEPHVAAIAAIQHSIAAGAVGGYFRFHFTEPATRAKRLLERCIAWRCRWGTVYGDQGIFVTRAAYGTTPGFAVQPLFEEVALVRALKRTGRFVAVPLPVTVSSVSWERDGYLRRTLINRMLVFGWVCGISPVRLARWSGDRPRPAATGYGPSRGHSRSGSHEAHKG